MNVRLLFEFSIADQVIMTKNLQQFRTDIYETDVEGEYYILDVIRLTFLCLLVAAHFIELGFELYKEPRGKKLNSSRCFRLTAYCLSMGLFLTEAMFMSMQESSADVIAEA